MPVEPKRVEAIRECIEAMDWFSIKAGDHWASVAGLIAEKAFPELASDPPTAWLAPWDMTDAMETAVDAHAESNGYETWPWPPNVWEAARDAHTKEQGGT